MAGRLLNATGDHARHWWLMLEKLPGLRPEKAFSEASLWGIGIGIPVRSWRCLEAHQTSYVQPQMDIPHSRARGNLRRRIHIPLDLRNYVRVDKVEKEPWRVVWCLRREWLGERRMRSGAL